MLKLRRAGKAQSNIPDWLAMGAGERTIGDDIYLSGKHHF
jgi:hypothetical protein